MTFLLFSYSDMLYSKMEKISNTLGVMGPGNLEGRVMGCQPGDKCPPFQLPLSFPTFLSCRPPSTFSASLSNAGCMEGEFGGNPFSSSDWLWFFSKLTGNLLLWNLGFFWFFFCFPFVNQHRISLCGPEGFLEYKSSWDPNPPRSTVSLFPQIHWPRLALARALGCLPLLPASRNLGSEAKLSPPIPEATWGVVPVIETP